MADRTHKHDGDDGAIAPLYARLPRGPHQLARGEVAENQRQRMHGAMVEAVAANGYGRTSVRQVVSLAGVSRRAFYEQFTNKQDCFLSTLDLILSRAALRIEEAYRSSGGDIRQRMHAALSTYAELVSSNPKSARLVMIDAPAAGAAGWARLTRMLLTFEQMLSASFARPPASTPLPDGIVRAMAGGLHALAFARLREHREQEMGQIVEDMLDWTLACQSPAAARLGFHIETDLNKTAAGRAASRASAQPDHPVPIRPRPEQWRARVLESALEMAALEGYENLSPLRIVDHAGVSIDLFFNLFNDMEECFGEALERLSEHVRLAVGAADSGSYDWELGVRLGLARLMRHFAQHPTHANTVATGAFEMGQHGVQLNLELAREVARRLTARAPEGTIGSVAQEAIAGAIWHTVYHHAAHRRIEQLPAMADQLSYVVLAPAVGAERARRALARSVPPRQDGPADAGSAQMVRARVRL